MKQQKTPQEKKAESYAFERRDTYGESNKSSRKNVPRRKIRINRDYRRTVRQKLVLSKAELSEELADTLMLKQKTFIASRFGSNRYSSKRSC